MKLPFVSCATVGYNISRPVQHIIKLDKDFYRARVRGEERGRSEGLEREEERW